MNLKKKIRGFFTLTRKADGGFTLVELIVVIAILAILAGIGVPAYSAYVTKANKQADISLVKDIEHALTLAMYSNSFDELPAGKLVLNDGITVSDPEGNEVVLAGSEVETALKKVFGENYQNVMKLKYNNWTVASLFSGLTGFQAGMVYNSSYLSGGRSAMLLQDVEKFTAMARNLSEALTDEDLAVDMTLGKLYGYDLLDETAEKYGVKVGSEYKDANGDIKWDEWGEANSQEWSNLLVLAAAVDNKHYMDSLESGTVHEVSAATDLISTFSQYYAFAATCPEFSPVLDQYLDAMTADGPTTINGVTVNPVNSPDAGAIWYGQLQAAIDGYKNAAGQTYEDYTNVNNNDSTAFDDQFAFSYIMSALSNANPEDISGSLSDPTLFTEGAVKDLYDQYLNAVETMAAFGEDEMKFKDGEVAIIYNQGKILVMNSIGE